MKKKHLIWEPLLNYTNKNMPMISIPFLKDKKMEEPKISLTHEMTFDSGHRLANYSGKCSKLHGHTYKVIFTIRGNADQLNEWGGLLDFGDVKKVLKEYIDTKYDHKTMLKSGVKENEKLADAVPTSWITWMNNNPTAENIAREIYGDMKRTFRSQFKNIEVESVTLYETPKNAATYRENGQ